MDPVVASFPDLDAVASRLREVAEEAGDPVLAEASRRVAATDAVPDDRDALNTRLMDAFRRTKSSGAFALLFDLNQQHFLNAIQGRLRGHRGSLDASDVLQEVFFNIYRYPHRFDPERPEAFRHWTNRIIRNTVLKHLRGLARPVRFEFVGEELAERADDRTESPLRRSIHHEDEDDLGRAYLLTLAMYLDSYLELSAREQTALHLVEVEGLCYRDASRHLVIKVENLKMVIFRARRKMYRSMRKRFAAAGVTSSPGVN
jgi:RNA polymerase sigma factor (sigma-70 family)